MITKNKLMNNLRTGLGVFLITFNKDCSKILLLKRNEEKRKKYGRIWGNVGGKIEFGESSKEAILREVLQEIGLKLKDKDINLLNVKEIPKARQGVHAIHFFYVACIDENTVIKINEESDEHKWFSLSKLPPNMFETEEEIKKALNFVLNKFN